MSSEQKRLELSESPDPRIQKPFDENQFHHNGRPVLLITMADIKSKTRVVKIEWNRIYYQTFYFIIGFLLVILSASSYKDYSSFKKQYDYITNNWRKDYYMSIQLGQSSSLCSVQYDDSYIEMNSYQWPGTQNGCDCSHQRNKNVSHRVLVNSNSNGSSDESDDEITIALNVSNVTTPTPDSFQKYLEVGATCNSLKKKQHCVTVNYQDAQPLQLWSDGSYGPPIRLCGQTKVGFNFANSAPTGSTCQAGQIPCGSGDQLFCVNVNENCPINYVGFRIFLNNGNGVWDDTLNQNVTDQYDFISNLTANGSIAQAKTLGGILKITSQFYFYYFKNWTGYAPLSEVKVSQTFTDGGVCLTNDISNIDIFSKDYSLMNEFRVNCITDPRFIIFHKINEFQYYLCNNFAYVQQVLPYYEIDQDKNWGIYFRGYIQWNANCRGALFQQAIYEGDTLLDIQKAQGILIAISIIYFMVISLIFSLFSCLTACGFTWSCMDSQNSDTQSKKILYTEAFVKIFLQFVQISILSIAYKKTQQKKLFLQTAIQQQCSDTYTLSFFSNLLNALQADFWQYNISMLIIFTLSFVLDICLLILLFIRYKKKQNLNNNNVSVNHDDEPSLKMIFDENYMTEQERLEKQAALKSAENNAKIISSQEVELDQFGFPLQNQTPFVQANLASTEKQ